MNLRRLRPVAAALLLAWSATRAAAQPSPEAPPPVLRLVTADAPRESAKAAKTDAKEPDISLSLPTREQLFRLQSEAQALAEIRAEGKRGGYAVSFPPSATAGVVTPMPARPIQPAQAWLVSAPVCYHPLYFENRNAERYLWHVCGLQPALSTGCFLFNFFALPYHLVEAPPCSVECNTGLPLPGDPVPYMLPPVGSHP
jgi:hypothetical protein